MRGLLQEVDTKLLHDIPEMVYDEVLMSHLIDELLLFEQELRTILHYPPSYPSPLHGHHSSGGIAGPPFFPRECVVNR